MASQQSAFTRFAKKTSRLSGTPGAFLLAVAVVVAWLVTGPIFGFSDTWQLVIIPERRSSRFSWCS
jgi:low affinity Fe/Cu permease